MDTNEIITSHFDSKEEKPKFPIMESQIKDPQKYFDRSREIIKIWSDRKQLYKYVENREGTEIFTRESTECDFPSYTIKGNIKNKSIDDVCNMLFELNEDEAKQHIPFLKSYKSRNCDSDDNIKFINQVNKPGFFMADRHTSICHVKISDQGKIYLVGFSDDDPEILTPNKAIRTQLHRSVIELEQQHCDVSMHLTTVFDPKIISPPKWLTNAVVSQAVDNFNKWKKSEI